MTRLKYQILILLYTSKYIYRSKSFNSLYLVGIHCGCTYHVGNSVIYTSIVDTIVLRILKRSCNSRDMNKGFDVCRQIAFCYGQAI